MNRPQLVFKKTDSFQIEDGRIGGRHIGDREFFIEFFAEAIL
jgi:hypothetical protein